MLYCFVYAIDGLIKTVRNEEFEMPDKLVSMLVKFLEQNNGVLSKRAMEKEFSALSQKEVEQIESEYNSIFLT